MKARTLALWRKWKNIAGLLTNRLAPLKNRGVYSVGIHSCSAAWCESADHNEDAEGLSTKLQ